MNPSNHEISKHGRTFFYLCLAGSLVLVFLLWRPFITVILLSVICAIVLYPLYSRLVKLFANRKTLASLVTCLILIFLVIVPLAVLIGFLAQEATAFYLKISSFYLPEGILKTPQGSFTKLLEMVKPYIPSMGISTASLESQAVDILKQFINFIVQHSSSVISNISAMFMDFFLLIFTLFYFLRDGAQWSHDFSAVIPMPEGQKQRIVQIFKDVSRSTVVGILLTSLLQGVCAGIGFWIAGISPVLWGTAVAFASLIPVVGSALVWGPAAIVLMLKGSLWWGIFLLGWGVLVVGSLDNLLRPFLMRGATQVSPVWILFSILGGLELFGFTGILIGPLLLSLAITMVAIYREDYAPGENAVLK